MIGRRAEPDRSEHARFVAAVLGRELLAITCRALRPAGIPVMPLKGVLFQSTLYRDPAARPIVDVDLLVPEASGRAAASALRAVGFRDRPRRMSHERGFVRSGIPLPLDLHLRLFPRFRYRLHTEEVFRRSRPNSDLFGEPVRIPSALDSVAHVVGHMVNAHMDERRAAKYAEDLALLADWGALDPAETATHLEACGLSRAGRYALAVLGGGDASSFASRVLAALAPDFLGSALAGAAAAIIRSGPAGAARGTLPAYALSQDLPHATLALGTAAVERAAFGVLSVGSRVMDAGLS